MGAAYGLAAALANILGAVAVTSGARWSVRILDLVLSFAAGFLISVSVVDLIPEAIERGGATAPLVVLGAYMAVHLTQHTIGGHFHFGEETHAVTQLVSMTALVGLLMHTFVDGVAVASSLAVSQGLGTLVFLGVILHKLPEGLAISSLFLAAGASPRKAVLAAAALGMMTIAGVFFTEHIPLLHTHGLAVAAGVTLYVGASNLVPEVQQTRGWRIPASFVAGCLVYVGARSLTSI
jgi:ZIP family zinc transporter/zinc and cadmium transporter